jgi:F-type H+-transporting ATPase subunit b
VTAAALTVLATSSPLTKVIPGLMIWTIAFFAVVIIVLKRFAFGPVQKAIDDRRQRIMDAVNEADNAREEARNLLEEHRKLIGQAKSESEEILSEARRVGDAQRERVRQETEEDRQRRLEETRRQIEQATAQALGQIRDEVGKLSLLAAEKITRKSLTDKDQQRLIDEALAEIDFSALEGSPS